MQMTGAELFVDPQAAQWRAQNAAAGAQPMQGAIARALAPVPPIARDPAGTAPDPDSQDQGDQGELVQTITPPTPATEAIDAAARELLRAVGAGIASGDMTAALDAARVAVAPALAGPVIQVRRVTVIQDAPATISVAPAGQTPYLEYVEHRTLAEIWPEIGDQFGPVLASRKVRVWQGPLSERPDPDFVWNAATMRLVMSWLSRGATPWLFGPAGTGKTSLLQQIAARLGREFVRIGCTATTEGAELIGMTVPAASGGTVWQDGQLTRGFRRPGSLICVDEISVARAGAVFVLQSALDSHTLHIAETGEVVRAAAGVVLAISDNTNGTGDTTGQYEDTGRLNRATLDRPAAFIRVDYPSEGAEAEIIQRRTRCRKALAKALASFGARTRASAESGEVTHGVGLRRLIALAGLLGDGVDVETAVAAAVLANLPSVDRAHIGQLVTACLDPDRVARALGRAVPSAAPVVPASDLDL